MAPWRLRARTAEAAAALALARLMVARVPFHRWRNRLGAPAAPAEWAEPSALAADARRLARHVERAAGRLPFETKCLPRAIALAWMLRRRQIGYRLVIAVRPSVLRSGEDDLHAWVEAGGSVVIGDLPGPWAPILIIEKQGLK